MLNLSLKQLSAALAKREFSSVELTQYFLKRAVALNPTLNAFITLNPDASLALARQADAGSSSHPISNRSLGTVDRYAACAASASSST